MVVNLVVAPVQDMGQVQYKQIKPQEESLSTKGS
jgi:hypothetical protein